MTISRVGTPSAPTEAFATSVSRNCGTVVTGQLVNITLAGWNDTTNPTITAGFLTKTAGTATIGTVTLDRANSGNNGGGSFSWSAQWSFVVTAGGTLTVTAAGFPSSGGGSSLVISHAGAETTLSWADDSSRVEDANGQHTATDGQSALSTGNATSAGEAWFVTGLTLNNGAAVTITTPSGFSPITDNGANGASVEVLAHADDIVTTGTTQAAAWTFTALDGAAYNGQAATIVVYKETAASSDPTIVSASDTTPSPGQSVTITVTNAGASQGSSTLVWGGVTQTVTSWSDTSITFTADRGNNKNGVAANLVLTVGSVDSAPFSLTPNPPTGWSYINITSVSGTGAWPGIAVGDQVEAEAVTLAADGTFSVDARWPPVFKVRFWDATDSTWGTAADQTLFTAQGLVVGSDQSWVGFGWVGAEEAAGAVTHTTSGALSAQDATIAGTAAHLTLHATSGALDAAAASISGTAAHEHAATGALSAQAAQIAGTAAKAGHEASGALSAQVAVIAGAAAHEHAASGGLGADSATVEGTAAHLTLHATSGALSAQDASVAGAATHERAATGALTADASAIAGDALRETPSSTHDTSGDLAADSATVSGDAAHFLLHATSGALEAQAAQISGTAAHHHATSGALASDAATVAGTAAHEHVASGALAADAATVAGTAEHSAAGTFDASGDLQADSATMSGEAAILALFTPRSLGFEMGGEPARPKRRGLVTVIKDEPEQRQKITKRDVDRRVFEKAREEARALIANAAEQHATTPHAKAERFAQVRTSLKPLSKALGDWNWIAVYQRMYQDALDEQIRQELAREDAIASAAQAEADEDERQLVELIMEWM